MTLSQAGLQAALSQDTDECFIECIKIEHSSITTIKLVNDRQNLARGDGGYWGFNGTADGWTANGNCTLTTNATFATVTPIGTNPDHQIQSAASLGINGGQNTKVRARIRRVAGAVASGTPVQLFYQTTLRASYSSSYRKDIADSTLPQLVTNQNFESGNVNWTPGGGDVWTVGEYGVAHTGTWSARKVADGVELSEDRLFSDHIPCTVGTRYTFGGRLQLSADHLGGNGAIMGIFWYTASNAFVSANFSPTLNTRDGLWYTRQQTVAAPATAASMRLVFIAMADHSAGTVYADNGFVIDADSQANWVDHEWDMSDLTAGGTDWVDSTISRLRLDFGQDLATIYDIDWIAVGEEWIAFPFRARLQPKSEDRIAEAEIVFDNVDQRIINALRGLSDGATLTYEVTRENDPGSIEVGPYEFEIMGFTADASTISLRVSGDFRLLNEAWPKDWFSPSNAG